MGRVSSLLQKPFPESLTSGNTGALKIPAEWEPWWEHGSLSVIVSTDHEGFEEYRRCSYKTCLWVVHYEIFSRLSSMVKF